MSSFLETLKVNIEEMESNHLAKGNPPLSIADKSILDQNNITIEEFIDYINPYCTVVSQHVISNATNRLHDKGIPEGAHVRVFMIVGRDTETKELLWSVYGAEDALYDSNYFMSQLLLYTGTSITRSKICINTSDGPAFQENTY